MAYLTILSILFFHENFIFLVGMTKGGHPHHCATGQVSLRGVCIAQRRNTKASRSCNNFCNHFGIWDKYILQFEKNTFYILIKYILQFDINKFYNFPPLWLEEAMAGSHSRSCDTWAGLTLLVIAKATLIQRSWITLPGVFVQKIQPHIYLGALQAA